MSSFPDKASVASPVVSGAAGATGTAEIVDTDGAAIVGTNLGEAARLSIAAAPSDAANRIVLISDGNETAGSLLAAAVVLATPALGQTFNSQKQAFRAVEVASGLHELRVRVQPGPRTRVDRVVVRGAVFQRFPATLAEH